MVAIATGDIGSPNSGSWISGMTGRPFNEFPHTKTNPDRRLTSPITPSSIIVYCLSLGRERVRAIGTVCQQSLKTTLVN